MQASALRRNLSAIRSRVGPEPSLIPMVKADGYGLGMDRAVSALEPLAPAAWGVATTQEGSALRRQGVSAPVIVFSPSPMGSLDGAVEDGLTVSISDLESLAALREIRRRRGTGVSFQVEVDTGMGRAGFDWREAETWARGIGAALSAGLRWTGCYTHLHSADEDGASVRVQWERFQDVLASLELPARDFKVHALNSAGCMRCPELAADAVRPGIFMYGGAVGVGLPTPEPVAALRARVVFVRDAPPGSTVGYGARHRASGWERWATVSIGYGDGLLVLLSQLDP